MAKNKKKKVSLLDRLKEFINGVKAEGSKVIWTSKKNLIKYSITALGFMVFVCLFFVGVDLLIALVSYVKELIG